MAALFVTLLRGCRLRRHVIQPRMRNAYAGLTLVLCGWVLLRMYKLMLPGYAVDLIRWSWYSYYLFFGLLVSLIVWIGYMASQPDWHPECPPWLRLLFSYNLVLAVLVCTNDIHQWDRCSTSWPYRMVPSFWSLISGSVMHRGSSMCSVRSALSCRSCVACSTEDISSAI